MVDWVVQLDIPEDVETYVHRVGRTARFKYEGKSLAFVAEHEMEFVNKLKERNINVHKIVQNPDKYFRIESSLQSICSEHQDVKYLAQRALISYIQFLYKSGNKSIFNIKKLDLELVAQSFGLQNAPQLSIVQDNDKDEDD
jgi:ATP-dependent RNA helicase DDX10/DBP4